MIVINGPLSWHEVTISIGPADLIVQELADPLVGRAMPNRAWSRDAHPSAPCALETKVRIWWDLADSSEPAPPAIVAAATENQQCDDNDQKGCGVHIGLLWIREP